MGKSSCKTNFEEALKEGRPRSVAKVSRAVSKKFETGRVCKAYNNTVILSPMIRATFWLEHRRALGFSAPKTTPFAASKIIAVLAEKLKIGSANVT